MTALLTLLASCSRSPSTTADALRVHAPAKPPVWPAFEAQERLPLEICYLDGIEEPLLCGALPVKLDRTRQDSRTIEIAVVVVPASSRPTSPYAWVEHNGGPGYAGIESAPQWVAGGALAYFREKRDIILFDQRGVGRSGALTCPSLSEERFLSPHWPRDRLMACKSETLSPEDLVFYATHHAVDDLEEVREWLGYEKLDVGGWSYGGKFMRMFMQRHPNSVRTATIFIPLVLDSLRPLNWARFGQQALDMLADECAASGPCAQAFPDVLGSFDRARARIKEHPVEVSYEHPGTGMLESAVFNERVFIEEVFVALIDPAKSKRLPLVLRQAERGDLKPFVEMITSESGLATPEPLYLSILCPEETLHVDSDEATALNRGTFLGNHFTDEYFEACEIWSLPKNPLYPMVPEPSPIPTLIVTGGRDPVAPAEFGHRIAQTLPNHRVFDIPFMTHGTWDIEGIDCVYRFIDVLVDTGTLTAIDTSCLDELRPSPFVLE